MQLPIYKGKNIIPSSIYEDKWSNGFKSIITIATMKLL